jgi:methyltransferase (TIGR00027 family)
MSTAQPSRTAVFVCQGRAVANGRLAVGRFNDPIAAQLLLPEELALVERARSDASPEDWRERLAVEALLACAEVVAPRTVAIDDAIGDTANDQVVIVGAGLDSRPWRLEALGGAAVFLVDHPAFQADARERSAALRPLPRRLEFVAADLATDRLEDALRAGSHSRSLPTTWIWEGVVPYLTLGQVEAAVSALAASSAPGSVLIVNYQTRSWINTLGRRIAGVATRLARQDDPLAGEPLRSLWTPLKIRELLGGHGFVVRRDHDLLSLAELIGSTTAHERSLRAGRVAVADFV